MKTIITGAFITIVLLFSAGCHNLFTPTYPKKDIPNAIRTICQKDYHINNQIDIKIAGKTLGIRIHLDNLFSKKLKIQKNSLDKIQKLLRVIRRVCLSTSANLNFFVIIGYQETLGLDIVFYRYITDLRKARAGWMSPDDYMQRLVKGMQMDTLRWGNIRIIKFFRDLDSGNMAQVLMNNFSLQTLSELNKFDTDFLKILNDLNKKAYIKWNVIYQTSTPVKDTERLYYLEAREYFTPKPEKIKELSYQSGVLHKFYILVNTEGTNPIIDKIYSKDALPEKYRLFHSPDKWAEDDFFVEDFTFQKFLARQIVQRIEYILNKDKTKKQLNTFTMDGKFIIRDKLNREVKLKDPSENIFKLTFKPRKNIAGKFSIPKKAIETSIETIKNVCNKYKFYDLNKIQLQDYKGKAILSINKANLFKH